MRTISLILGFFCFYMNLNSQGILHFEDAVQIGLQNNFNIIIARNNTRISENNITRGNAGFYPNILWTGGRSFSRSNVKQVFISGTENVKDGATSNTWNTGLSMDWTIFDGMKMFRTYDKLLEIKEQSLMEEKMAIENVILDISLAYYRVILEKNRIAALDSSLNVSERRVEISDARYRVGRAPKSEYLSARVDYNSDFSLLVKQKESLQIAKNNLNNFMGRNINLNFDVPSEMLLDTSLVLKDIISNTKKFNTSLENARLTGKILELEVKEIQTENLPQVNLNLDYTFNRLSSQAGFLLSNNTNGLNAGIRASWLIFEGKNRKRRYQNTKIDIENNEVRMAQFELDLMKDIENLYLAYSNNILLVKLEEENMKISSENAKIALDRYQLGKSDYLELREAQLNVVQNLDRLLNAVYSAKVNELNLLYLSGQILD